MIHSIDIENWKGHESLTLEFEKGVNFITGPNGIGKTSVLDAISFAFLGDIRFIGSYQGISYKNLIRDPNKSSKISLSFSFSDQRYEVVRTVNARNRSSLRCNDQIIKTQWDEVTKAILDMYKVSLIFFARFIVLSEGDTYEYINRPPGEGLAAHIENVLGIKRLDYLENNILTLNKEYEQKARSLRKKIKETSILTEKDIVQSREISHETQQLKNQTDNLSSDIAKIRNKSMEISIEIKTLQRILVMIEAIAEKYPEEFVSLSNQTDPLASLNNKIERINTDYSKITSEKNQITKKIGKLSALIEQQQSILDIVKPLDSEVHAENNCPICKRSLTKTMIKEISEEGMQNILSLQNDLDS